MPLQALLVDASVRFPFAFSCRRSRGGRQCGGVSASAAAPQRNVRVQKSELRTGMNATHDRPLLRATVLFPASMAVLTACSPLPSHSAVLGSRTARSSTPQPLALGWQILRAAQRRWRSEEKEEEEEKRAPHEREAERAAQEEKRLPWRGLRSGSVPTKESANHHLWTHSRHSATARPRTGDGRRTRRRWTVPGLHRRRWMEGEETEEERSKMEPGPRWHSLTSLVAAVVFLLPGLGCPARWR